MVRGLIHVLEALVGDTVTIELKNNSVVTGTLIDIDVNMTSHLSGAKVVPHRGEPEVHDELTIRGMNIRQFLLNDAVDIDTLLRKAAVNEKKAADKAKASKKGGGGADAKKRPFGGEAPKMAGKIRQRGE